MSVFSALIKWLYNEIGGPKCSYVTPRGRPGHCLIKNREAPFFVFLSKYPPQGNLFLLKQKN